MVDDVLTITKPVHTVGMTTGNTNYPVYRAAVFPWELQHQSYYFTVGNACIASNPDFSPYYRRLYTVPLITNVYLTDQELLWPYPLFIFCEDVPSLIDMLDEQKFCGLCLRSEKYVEERPTVRFTQIVIPYGQGEAAISFLDEVNMSDYREILDL